MLICSAEDGRTFEPDITLYELARQGSLKGLVSELTGIEQGNVICFLSDGQQIRDENLRQLAGTPDDTIYAFNREYLFLDTELKDVIRDLEVPLTFRPPLADPSLDTILSSAQDHLAYIPTVQRSLAVQIASLQVAAANLDSHVLSLSDVFDNFELIAMKELDRQASLLRNHSLDLEVISKIRVHHEFLSPNVRREVEAGLKERMLVDYISTQKMKLVVESCTKLHEDLSNRFHTAQSGMSTLTSGADEVRSALTPALREEADKIHRQALGKMNRLKEMCSSLQNGSPSSSTTLQDILGLEQSIRHDVEDINDLKNQSTAHTLTVLRQVSFLQSTLAELPAALTALETDLRNKGGFTHMQRLHNMIYTYGATVIEIVRRKEFTKFFVDKAQVIAEVMARLSSNERKRRQTYRGEVHGQLPFDAKGMDDPTPSLEISTNIANDNLFSLSKDDIARFMDALLDIERSTVVPTLTPGNSPPDDGRSHSALGQVIPHPLKETRAALEKLISRIEGLSAEFDRLMERSVLSPDRLVRSKRRTESDASAYREAIDQLREMRDAQAAREQAIQDERENSAAEIRRLSNDREDATRRSREQTSRLENEIVSLRAALERETAARSAIESRHAELLTSMEDKEQKLQSALVEATSKTKEAELLSRELERARAEAEEHNRIQAANDEKLSELLSEQAEALRKLEEARSRGEDLEDQIKFARTEADEAFRALNEATREKDRLLRTQSLEADRLLRDHIAEADGDRAVLEHQFFELQAAHETTERELKEALAEVDVSKADLVGVREELQRTQHEFAEGESLQSALREEVVRSRSRQDDLTRKLVSTNRLVSDLLDLAVAFRDTNTRILSNTQKILSHSARMSSKQIAASMIDSTLDGPHDSSKAAEALAAYTTPIDWSDPVASIQILKKFDIDAFSDTVLKGVNTIRKWQKQCKEYRDRARGKITFRNFAKGDLALFLPTRNNISKPWAAFNVSFPHYFLKSTPHVAQQLESREWIVARITSITERVVDNRDPNTNPYGLGNGVKFYMLEVEDYAPPAANQRRTVSAPLIVADSHHQDPNDPSNPQRRVTSATLQSALELTEGGSSPDMNEFIEPPSALPPPIPSSSPQPIPYPSLGGVPSSLAKMLAQTGSPPFSSEMATSPSLEEIAEMSKSLPSAPPPAPPPLIPREHRKRTSSGHSHSLMRPSFSQQGQPQSPLRRTDSRNSIHSSRPSTAVSTKGQFVPAISASPSKAAATTALADEALMERSPVVPPQLIALPPATAGSDIFSSSPPARSVTVLPSSHSRRSQSQSTATPSPSASATEGLSNLLLSRTRKRTMSHKAPPSVTSVSSTPAPSTGGGGTLASLASSWRITLGGRGRKESTASSRLVDPVQSEADAESASAVSGHGTIERGTKDARSLLRKLDAGGK